MCGILKAAYISEYTDCLLQVVCATAFFRFLRCGEFTTEQQNFDPHSNLCLSDLTFSDGHVDLFLKSSKTDPFRQGIIIPLFKLETFGFMSLHFAKKYLAQRTNRFVLRNLPSEPLFLTEFGDPLRTYFITHVKELLKRTGLDIAHYSGHSYRIGAASSACTVR